LGWSCWNTPAYISFVSGSFVIYRHVKENMKQILGEITDGSFAERFIRDQDAGAPEFRELRQRGAQHPSESVGKDLRALMAWAKADPDYTEGSPARSPRSATCSRRSAASSPRSATYSPRSAT